MRKLNNFEALQARANFVNFCTRDGLLTTEQAREELTRLFANVVRPRLRESYLMGARIGASFTLNRTQRIAVYTTFENALNHATFEATE